MSVVAARSACAGCPADIVALEAGGPGTYAQRAIPGTDRSRAGTVTATIPVGTGPEAVAVNPVTGSVYVTNSRSNSVSVIFGPRFPRFF